MKALKREALLVRQKRDDVAVGESVHRVSQQEVHIRSRRLSGAASRHFWVNGLIVLLPLYALFF